MSSVTMLTPSTDMSEMMPPSTATVIMFFGSVGFATAALLTKSWLLGDIRALNAALSASSSMRSTEKSKLAIRPLEQNFFSIFILLHHLSILGMVIFSIYTIEYHPYFAGGTDRFNFDEDSFVFLMMLCLLMAILTIKRNTILPDQVPLTTMTNDFTQQDEDDITIEDSRTDETGESTSMAEKVSAAVSVSSSKRSGKSKGSFEDINLHPEEGHSLNGKSVQSDGLSSVLESNTSGTKSTFSVSSSNLESTEKTLDDILLDDDDASSLSSNRSEVKQLETKPCHPLNDVLNQNQCLEMKGIMTCYLLIYQCTNAGSYDVVSFISGDEEDESQKDVINYYYNMFRLQMTSYLFLTGFGHGMFFQKTKDYSMRRFLQALLRLNLSATFMCMALGKPYIFYWACSIHTYFFIIIYITMRWKKEHNHTRYGLRIKIFMTAMVIFVVWDCDFGLFWPLHAIVFGSSQEAVSGAPYGQLWEFYFRAHLHHWAALIGVIFAINQPVTSLFMRKLEAIGNPAMSIGKGFTCFMLLGAVIMWVNGPFLTSKYAYNATNPYFGFLPILFYVYLRNITATFREHHFGFFKYIGSYSLELYLLHHHAFVSGDLTTKLVLISGYPACNLICVLMLLFLLAIALNTATSVITSVLVNNIRDQDSLRNLIGLAGALGFLHIMSLLIYSMQMASFASIITATIIFGVLLFQTIIDLTWVQYQSSRPYNMHHHHHQYDNQTLDTDDSFVAKVSPPAIGTLIILILGLGWQVALVPGAGLSNNAPLPPICSNVINDGAWINIKACSYSQEGQLLLSNKEYEVSQDSDKYIGSHMEWAWSQNELTPSNCRFRHRTSDDIQNVLIGRNVVFIGDAMIRQLFQAVRRALGDTNAGSYDSTVSLHSDITIRFGEMTLQFKWAPLAVDVLAKLKSYQHHTTQQIPGTAASLDLIIAGGGAWDRLHIWATDEDQKSYDIEIQKLANELLMFQQRMVPTVWFTPTTINTQALDSEEKRTQMSEENVQLIRELYGEIGVTRAASFVLDGPSFTRDVVRESYDGIQYPHSVYDVGAQILANALDWLLVMDFTSEGASGANSNMSRGQDDINNSHKKTVPKLGVLANPLLGIMVLCVILVGLMFYDGYLGFSLAASIFVRPPTTHRFSTSFYTSRSAQIKFSVLLSDLEEEINLQQQGLVGRDNDDEDGRRKKQEQDASVTNDLLRNHIMIKNVDNGNNGVSGLESNNDDRNSTSASIFTRRTNGTKNLATITEDIYNV